MTHSKTYFDVYPYFGNMIPFFVKSKSDPIPCTQLPIKAVYFRLVKVFGMLQWRMVIKVRRKSNAVSYFYDP